MGSNNSTQAETSSNYDSSSFDQAEREHEIIKDISKVDVVEPDIPSYSIFISGQTGDILDTIQNKGGTQETKENIFFAEKMADKDLDDCNSREIADLSRILGGF